MSYIKQYFHNIKCDRCGTLLDEEMWHHEKDTLESFLEDNGFIEHKGKHYCIDCYDYDDEDNIKIKSNDIL